MKIRVLIVAAMVAGLPMDLGAQQPVLPSVPQSLSLGHAIDLALAYSPTLRQIANDRSGAAWGVRNAYASFLPRVDASGSVNYLGAGSQRFLTQEVTAGSSTLGSSYNLFMSLTLSGRTLMQPGVANAQLRATEATITGAEINLESTIKQQYLGVLEAEAQVEQAELQLTRNEEFLRLASARFDVGQNTILEVRRAQVARGQSEVALIQARQAVTVEKLRLFQLMGVPAPTDPAVVTLTDTFPITEPQWQLEALLAAADEQNPDLGALRAQESAAQANERASKSTWLPTLSLRAGWQGFTQQFTNSQFLIDQSALGAQTAIQQCEFADQFWLNPGLQSPVPCAAFAITPEQEQQIRDGNEVFPFSFTTQPFAASLTVSLPIFTQFSRPLEVSQAAAQSDDAREAVRARELRVHTDVSQAYYTLLTAYETIQIQEENRTAGSEQLRLATERYRIGSGTFIELLDAQVAALGAEADYITAVYSYHRSIATLESAVGRPLR